MSEFFYEYFDKIYIERDRRKLTKFNGRKLKIVEIDLPKMSSSESEKGAAVDKIWEHREVRFDILVS